MTRIAAMARRVSSTVSSDSNVNSKSCIKLSPREVIRFVSKYSSYYLSEDIVLVNKGPDAIMYKIKSNTKSRRYRLSTSTGIIQGHSGLRIQIILDGAEAKNIVNDVIVVETQYCNSDEISSDDDLHMAMRRYHEKQKGVTDKRGVSFRLRCVLDVSQTEVDFADNGTSYHSNLSSSARGKQTSGSGFHGNDGASASSPYPQPPGYNAAGRQYASDSLPPGEHIREPGSSGHMTYPTNALAIAGQPNASKMCLGDNYVQYRRVTDANKTTQPEEINSLFEAITSYFAQKHNLRINWSNIVWGLASVLVFYLYTVYAQRKELMDRLAQEAEARISNEGWFSSFFRADAYDD